MIVKLSPIETHYPYVMKFFIRTVKRDNILTNIICTIQKVLTFFYKEGHCRLVTFIKNSRTFHEDIRMGRKLDPLLGRIINISENLSGIVH